MLVSVFKKNPLPGSVLGVMTYIGGLCPGGVTSYRNIYAHVVYIAELVWLPVVSDRLFKCFLSTPVSATLFLHYRNDEDIGGILLWTPA